ncbi:MAG: hypothetical protein C4575_12320 [Desulforudis sp.]|nr:hypothetical protein [Clostridia bacterium]MDQ7791064.1 hypothetical protein [Clostridia bacterium]RJX17886.1 MAG: hypothetical protein C4575_12320 [Desulforudis sp.]
MAESIHVFGILVEQRAVHGPDVQEVLTRYGSSILSRNGIPDPSKSRGVITVTVQAEPDHAAKFRDDLRRVDGVHADFVNLGEAFPNTGSC